MGEHDLGTGAAGGAGRPSLPRSAESADEHTYAK